MIEVSADHHKRRLLVLSHVLPFPRDGGQHQRVFQTLHAARDRFHVTFATIATANADRVRQELLTVCDDLVLLPSAYGRSAASRLVHRAAGTLYAATTGLKRSNYEIGCVEFSRDRISKFFGSSAYDVVLFEYWHAAASTAVFQQLGIPCVLDMHDILARSYARTLQPSIGLLRPWKRWALNRYQVAEERAWRTFDALVAINSDEQRLAKRVVGETMPVFHAPMGADLSSWPYSPAPSMPPRIAFYGALGGAQNQQMALRCATQILPAIWRSNPDVEFWLVGSNPPDSLRRLVNDPRVKVTGFIDPASEVLRTMTAVLCPWVGTFGFRSRLIEVMALGVPVVVTADAIYGMELEQGSGVLVGGSDDELARHTLALVTMRSYAREQGALARMQVERAFSLKNTYGRLMDDLLVWLCSRESSSDRDRIAVRQLAPTGSSELPAPVASDRAILQER